MTLSIKDLEMAQQLDRKAMAATRGGRMAPGLRGYEGQPGNQGGPNHSGQGLLGYEGQPGNQGGLNGGSGPAPGLLGFEGQPGNQGG